MMTIGLLSRSRGACPRCGRDVDLTHRFNGLSLVDTYGCRRCGDVSYTLVSSC